MSPTPPTPTAPPRLTTLQRFIFASRWLQLPLYVGLILAQGVYVYHFWVELVHLIEAAFGSQTALAQLVTSIGYKAAAIKDASGVITGYEPIKALNETIIMLVVLALIDVVMISNLLIMVIIGGYETFVSRLNLEGHPDQPEWLSHVNASVLKVKLATAIIGISSIHLLKTFINAANYEDKVLLWQTVIHIAFLFSALAIALADRLMTAPPGGKGTLKMGPLLRAVVALLILGLSGAAQAAEIDGAKLSAWWGLPFAGMLLSIAIMPLAIPHIWHHHFGKIAAGWALLLLVPFAMTQGLPTTGGMLVHVLLAEYLPFIILLTALFTVAGGIYIRGNLHGSPGLNTALMAIGAVLASFMGTTGASMLLIRPLIRANDNRKHVAHVVVFFIFIVSNAGGSLTPLGDPPLFLGFLKGVDFFWTVKTIFPETLFLVGSLLAIFYVIDSYWYRKEGVQRADPTPDDRTFGIEGGWNFLLLAAVAGLVLMSGAWKPGIEFNILGTEVGLPQLVRDGALVAITLISLAITRQSVRQDNQFSWAPMQEVAKLFIGIFVTMVPVLAMLKAGEGGAFAAVTRAVTGPDGQPIPWAYFWFSGALSSFLDNAPTYLVFFNLAGGDPQVLMTTLAPTLAAVSAGSVFMGANTYIGNAPNFMVKAIAEDRGIRMPSFFGYMLWSGAILIPLFVVMTLIWFR